MEWGLYLGIHPLIKGGANNAYGVSGRDVFGGGIPSDSSKVSPNCHDIAVSLLSDIADKFDSQGYDINGFDFITAARKGTSYSGYYASGIVQNSAIKIALNQPAGDDVITWKASLPVTITYL
ncbi:hypothetical protein [Escherichia coli]|uniref:F4 family fimbrial subunit n=1 Tax=Escherichia coli TaxID=562 RepID=UPI00287B1B74|nr:hypothetical protein [Escherichia coli]MDS1718625.1 hypothetical protein [Escherichia coli]HCH7319692.1 hypothetical protein [Escherichia coli]